MIAELTAKVIVIDDSAPTRQFLEAWLTSAGCEVITASSGVGAVPLVTAETGSGVARYHDAGGGRP